MPIASKKMPSVAPVDIEGINGTRDRRASDLVLMVLRELSPEMIDDMSNRHDIEPVGPTPWIKTFTAGSDDHGGLYIASTARSASRLRSQGRKTTFPPSDRILAATAPPRSYARTTYDEDNWIEMIVVPRAAVTWVTTEETA